MVSKKSRIFNVMQYEFNPATGEDLHFNEENILSCIAHKTIKKWAYIFHDKDVVTKEDSTINDYFEEGKKKPAHWHIVLKCDNAVEIATIAKWLSLPPQFIDVPRGHGAFLDCIQYLTHEAENQQAKGKHLYNDEEVKANFDFRKELTERAEKISKYGQDLDPRKQMFHDVLYGGKTIRECIQENDILYMDNVDKIKKYRLEYIQQQTPPTSRINYYITGSGGVGKDLISRALARSLYPQYEYDDDIFFIVGSENATFEGYDGQPVVIWSDFRAFDLMQTLGDRGNVFRVFDTHPTKQRQNIKYGSINLINTVNIVNSVQPYMEFLDGLSGEYVKNGVLQKSEENQKKQSYRRFPFIIPLYENDFALLLNKGFLYNTTEFLQYEEYTRIRGNMQQIAEVCRDRQDLARQIEQRTLQQIVYKHNEVLEKQKQTLTEEQILKKFENYGKVVLNLNRPLSKDELPFL